MQTFQSRSSCGVYYHIILTCVNALISGWIPDFVIRYGIRLQLGDRARIWTSKTAEQQAVQKQAFVDELKSMPIAVCSWAQNFVSDFTRKS